MSNLTRTLLVVLFLVILLILGLFLDEWQDAVQGQDALKVRDTLLEATRCFAEYDTVDVKYYSRSYKVTYYLQTQHKGRKPIWENLPVCPVCKHDSVILWHGWIWNFDGLYCGISLGKSRYTPPGR